MTIERLIDRAVVVVLIPAVLLVFANHWLDHVDQWSGLEAAYWLIAYGAVVSTIATSVIRDRWKA